MPDPFTLYLVDSRQAAREETEAVKKDASEGEFGYVISLPDPADFEGVPYPEEGVRVRLRMPGPPWFVIHEAPEFLRLPTWPVRLWRVANWELAPEQVGARGWFRASAFTVDREADAAIVFGPEGKAVAAVIERCRTLDGDDAQLLAGAIPPGAYEAFVNAWDAFSAASPRRTGSPVGDGFLLIQQEVEAAARRTGLPLFEFDPVDGVDVLADTTWVAALRAALYMAMASGAPSLVGAEDRATLAHAWRQAFG